MSVSTNFDSSKSINYTSQAATTNVQNKHHHRHKAEGEGDNLMAVGNATSSTKRKNPLDALVEAGTITADQEKAIKDAFEASRLAFQSKINKSDTLTSATSGTSATGTVDGTGRFVDPLAALVTAGTITQDQSDAIKTAFETARKSHRMPPPPPIQNGIESIAAIAGNDSTGAASNSTNSTDSSLLNDLQIIIQAALKAYENQSGDKTETLLQNANNINTGV